MSNPSQPERLSKQMAQQGLCSRREADDWIQKGWVLVDGKVVNVLGTKILPGQKITLAPQARSASSQLLTVLLNKPVGYVSGQPEKNYPPAVRLITPDHYYSSQPLPSLPAGWQTHGLAPAGRLDIDSQGLLVLTQDGRIARHLIGSGPSVEKEYLVRVMGACAEKQLRRLRHGLSLDGKPLLPAKIKKMGVDYLQIILVEGRKRQIRRMCQLVGLQVVNLKRVRIGQVRLGSLPLGQWRFLAKDESF